MAGETDRGREETSPEGQAPGVLRDIRDAAHSDSSAPQSDKRQPGSSDAGEQRIERVEAALAERDERMKESQGSWSQDHFHGYHLTNNHGFAVKIVAGEIKKAGGMLSEERLSEFHEANWEWRQGQLNDREHRYAAAVEQSNAEIEATLGLTAILAERGTNETGPVAAARSEFEKAKAEYEQKDKAYQQLSAELRAAEARAYEAMRENGGAMTGEIQTYFKVYEVSWHARDQAMSKGTSQAEAAKEAMGTIKTDASEEGERKTLGDILKELAGAWDERTEAQSNLRQAEADLYRAAAHQAQLQSQPGQGERAAAGRGEPGEENDALREMLTRMATDLHTLLENRKGQIWTEIPQIS